MTGTYRGVQAFSESTGNTPFPTRLKRMLDGFLMRTCNPNKDEIHVLNSSGIPTTHRCTSWPQANGTMTPIRCHENYRAELKVAQISAYGWVDFFTGVVESCDVKYDEWTHFCLLPSEAEKFVVAYQEWQALEVIRNERKAIAPTWDDKMDFFFTASGRAEFV